MSTKEKVLSNIDKVFTSFHDYIIGPLGRGRIDLDYQDPQAMWEEMFPWFRHRGWFEPSNETKICRAIRIIVEMEKSVCELKRMILLLNSLEYIKEKAQFYYRLLQERKAWVEEKTLDECFKIKYLEARTKVKEMEEKIKIGENYISIMRLVMVECGHKVEAVSLNA
jgi:hypothetical protein